MLRIQQRLISFSIVSHKIAHTTRDYKNDPTLNFYPVVGLKDVKLGTISLNQPNNQNFLTTQMMGQLFRFLNSYHHDHSVENVWVQNRGSVFLGGISYQQLINNPQYLDKLYKMTVMVAKLNKPMFSFVQGGVRNVGAYVLSMASVALTDYTASLRIDQVSKGFIPVAGGSHRLSRLPLNVGYYLALTGKKLDSNQMSRLGFITAIAKQGVSSKQMRQIISKSNLFFRDRVRVNIYDKRDQQYVQWSNILLKQQALEHQISINQLDILRNQQNVFAKFAMNQYKIAQINYQNATKPFNSFSQKPGRHINNYFRMRHQKAYKFLQNQKLIQTSQYNDVRLPGFQLDKIIKLFDNQNLLDVIKALQKDSSQWGTETLKQLRRMDPLAAVLTFQLLKRAQNLSWDQCLDLQYTVAKRLLANSKLQLKQTYSGSKFVLTNKYSSTKIQDIPLQNVLQQYFSAAFNEDQKLERQVPSISLLPNNNYKNIPDSARLAMNQQFFDDIHLVNQQKQMKRWLESNKIDYRNKSYDIHALRQKIYNKQQFESIQLNQTKRLQYILNNSKVLRQFIQQRINHIDQISNQNLQKIIEQTVKNTVNNGIKTRFEQFEKTAQIIGKQNKLQIFKNLRKMLVKNIVINGTQIQQADSQKNDIFKGVLYFDKNKSVFDTTNPHLDIHAPLKKLVQQVTEKREISKEFAENEGSEPMARHVGFPNEITKRQNYVKRIQENIAKRYLQNPFTWNKAFEYKQMVKQASKTSSQLAQYLQWDSNAFYATIQNAPATRKTYAEYGQNIIHEFDQQRRGLKSLIKTQTILSQTLSEQFFSQVYQTQQPSSYKPSNYIRQQIVPKFGLTKQIQKFIAPILQQVLKIFEEKYYNESLQQKKLQFGEFDKYIFQAQDKQFVEYYKNDILFVYSYFAILKVKDVLHNLKISGIKQKPQDFVAFFKQFNIEFNFDTTIESMNKVLSKFIFNMLDIHTYTKPKIRLPQNKLLDFLNRTKISRQVQKKSLYPLSFESLLLMISKDRSRIYNKILQQFIPTEPQYLLQIANQNTKDQLNLQYLSKGTNASTFYTFQNSPQNQIHLESKRLVSGYQYYLGLFDSFIHRASGKYNFINDELLSLDIKKLKQDMSNILKISQKPEDWFIRITKLAISNFFNNRLNLQKNLTKGELLAFDQQLKQLLQPQTFKLILKFFLQSQISSTKQYFQKVRHYKYQTTDSQKHQQMYCDIRRNIKNPQAFKRLNNLKMAMDVHRDYYIDSQKKSSNQTNQQKEDLQQQKRQFANYQRFPKQTYNRLSHEIYEYGQQKNFDRYLNPINQTQIDKKRLNNKLHFIDDQRQNRFKKQSKFTDFEEQIKLLRSTINRNNNNQEVDSIFKKLQELL